MLPSILTRLQADVYARLCAVPSLATANVIIDDAGDIENKVVRGLQTLSESTGGKRGLAVVVFPPEVSDADENLPGPPLESTIEIQVVEQVVINRDEASGTGIRSSTAALNVLRALHHAHLGDVLLYAGKDPLKVIPVKPGHVSHGLSLRFRLDLDGQTKCVTPEPEIANDTLILTCANPAAAIWYATDGTYPAPQTGGSSLYTDPLPLADGGTSQIETLHISGYPQANGVVSITVTGNGINGGANTYTASITCTPTKYHYPSQIAADFRAALAAESAITTLYTVGGINEEVTLTRTIPAANDETLNIGHGAITGMTAQNTSTNIQEGIAPTPGLAAGDVIRTAAYAPDILPSDVLEFRLTA